MSKTRKIELLSPAGNLESGIAAINCGADAVYIGAPKFGARAAAGNSIKDIETLIQYAHKYWAKVYITVNTLLYDKELPEAEKLIGQLYEAGADAIIIQDFGILEMNLPPIPLFASTQTNNKLPEKVRLLESAGFSRAILARELSIEQIKEIKYKTNIDLEFFVHGALCVCYSGQCYFSLATTGRSANRGECSQPCRMMYDLTDADGNVIIKDKYLLSLKDLNLSLYIKDLIDAGISSFKIEGRLKDSGYVKNVTAYYRQIIDEILEGDPDYSKSSSGNVKLFFTPDPEKSFNRGFTDYFVSNENKSISSFNSPKSTGKEIGTIVSSHKNYFVLYSNQIIVSGDGLCYFDQNEELSGMSVNKIEGNKIFPNEMKYIKPGTVIYRNRDHAFEKALAGKYAERKIDINITLSEASGRILISACDSDYNTIEFEWDIKPEPADKPELALENIRKQLLKSGDSLFHVSELNINLIGAYFFRLSALNELRRSIFDQLEKVRASNRPFEHKHIPNGKIQLFDEHLDYRSNVINEKSEKFYSVHGSGEIEPGLELQNKYEGKVIMTCKYCIKNELGICPLYSDSAKKYSEPLYLSDKKRKYRLLFDCKKCEMSILY